MDVFTVFSSFCFLCEYRLCRPRVLTCAGNLHNCLSRWIASSRLGQLIDLSACPVWSSVYFTRVLMFYAGVNPFFSCHRPFQQRKRSRWSLSTVKGEISRTIAKYGFLSCSVGGEGLSLAISQFLFFILLHKKRNSLLADRQ